MNLRCIPIAPIPAARCAPPTQARRSRLSGWVHRKRDHGNLLFIDLRDHYGITQCVIDAGAPAVRRGDGRAAGKRRHRHRRGGPAHAGDGQPDAADRRDRGADRRRCAVESPAEMLPMQVAGEQRLRRGDAAALPLPRPAARAAAPQHRAAQPDHRVDPPADDRAGFIEFQTPILTASSPGGRARLSGAEPHPSRQVLRPAAGAAAVQAAADGAGFDRYFQIAPCFRDEDARADRSPGEFYQLDFEMASSPRRTCSPRSSRCWPACSRSSRGGRAVTAPPFPRIPFDESMLEYGTDKPDLRNPLLIADVTRAFRRLRLRPVRPRSSPTGGVVRAIPAPGAAAKPRSFFDKLNEWARERGRGRPRLHHLRRRRGQGPDRQEPGSRAASRRCEAAGAGDGDAVFFVCRREGAGGEVRRPGARAAVRRAGACASRTPSASAGSSTSRCTSATRTPARSSSATTRSRCRRAGWRR